MDLDIDNCSTINYYDDTNSFLTTIFITSGVLITGGIFATIVIAQILFNEINKEFKNIYGYDSDNEDIFCKKYLDEYEELENTPIDNSGNDISNNISIVDLIELKDLYVLEHTPSGFVYMGYDEDKKSFWYYCDYKNIKYNYLDVVARKFVVRYNCKGILFNTKKELLNAFNEYKSRKEAEENNDEQVESVFANLKQNDSHKKISYDYTLKIKDTEIPVPENSNNYIYKGNISDYESILYPDKKEVKEFEDIDYNVFKNK